MIEVVPAGNGFTWRMIGADGRALVSTGETWPCGLAAAEAARSWRAAFWAMAARVDHRMGACI